MSLKYVFTLNILKNNFITYNNLIYNLSEIVSSRNTHGLKKYFC